MSTPVSALLSVYVPCQQEQLHVSILSPSLHLLCSKITSSHCSSSWSHSHPQSYSYSHSHFHSPQSFCSQCHSSFHDSCASDQQLKRWLHTSLDSLPVGTVVLNFLLYDMIFWNRAAFTHALKLRPSWLPFPFIWCITYMLLSALCCIMWSPWTCSLIC